MKFREEELDPLLQRISLIDFNNLYTPFRRFMLHISMWFVFGTLLFFNYKNEGHLSNLESIILSGRLVINNMIIFYLFFYLFIPRVFKIKNWSILIIFLSTPLLFYMWLSTNYFQFYFLNLLEFDVHSGPLQNIVSKNANQSYFDAVSFKKVLSNAIIVMYAFSPSFFLKILFDITRLFNKAISFQKKNMSLELQNVNIEKDFLKAQLNPHFLFNTLNNLYGLVVSKNPLAAETIINISDLMSYTLYESNIEKVPLQKELDFIKNYFFLERMRYSADKDIFLDISSDENNELEIAPLLCFTFIENAFKYGLQEKNNNFLHITIKIVNNIFYFAIENNKEEFKKKTALGGIGLKNTQKRLSLIYPDSHELKIEDRNKSFFVFLKINLSI
ncbi:sensor histidine kinase [uncultured Chryseobacterium sp.]|uniref:sensor histidine kinase n=1 Tax=uncultured Chryseobacterium sp. TaxID=259322 RepID=UPI0025EEA882|nr:sensor histidine kinase [uncultured Chryseobacterium sp.]